MVEKAEACLEAEGPECPECWARLGVPDIDKKPGPRIPQGQRSQWRVEVGTNMDHYTVKEQLIPLLSPKGNISEGRC